MAAFLASQGAPALLDLLESTHHTAAQLAQDKGHVEVAAVLLKAAARSQVGGRGELVGVWASWVLASSPGAFGVLRG